MMMLSVVCTEWRTVLAATMRRSYADRHILAVSNCVMPPLAYGSTAYTIPRQIRKTNNEEEEEEGAEAEGKKLAFSFIHLFCAHTHTKALTISAYTRQNGKWKMFLKSCRVVHKAMAVFRADWRLLLLLWAPRINERKSFRSSLNWNDDDYEDDSEDEDEDENERLKRKERKNKTFENFPFQIVCIHSIARLCVCGSCVEL